MKDLKSSLGIGVETTEVSRANVMKYLNLKLAAKGLPIYEKADVSTLEISTGLIETIREKDRLLHDYLCPADARIQKFLDTYFEELPEDERPKLPKSTLTVDRHGMARELSIAPDQNSFIAENIKSYRVKQGVVHNPKNDRRTTKGVFHVVEGGLPIPFDKKEVPKIAFARMMKAALCPPEDQLELPYTSSQEKKAKTFVSLLLRPMVAPEVPGYIAKTSMEVRYFTPGNYISNIDFVESIFGNAGDPYLPVNDSGLDTEHWSGHSGCIILVPHILGMSKKELGLPHYDDATERQRKDGMCYKSEDEKYNDASPFKITCRDESGVIVTMIADNYFGYSKKEVKTQIGYASNLFGMTEEEHAGGAYAVPRRNLGRKFTPDSTVYGYDHKFEDMVKIMADSITIHKDGYATDNNYPNIYYIPEDAKFNVDTQLVTWAEGKKSLKLLLERTFIYPVGLQINLEKHPSAKSWRLVGTISKGTMCHKPCTVSGGGKSEISKSIQDAMFYGPIFITDYEKDMAEVETIINKDYSGRFKAGDAKNGRESRTVLSSKRSLGSVIKLLNPSSENNDEFNAWLSTISNRTKGLVFLLKRHYKSSWGDDWKSHFTVDVINGEAGHELKLDDRKLAGGYLRVGSSPDGIWRTCKLRLDYMPSAKVQWEDDISASVVVPMKKLDDKDYSSSEMSVKFADNCEARLFQRPDDAVIIGYDKQAESDMSENNVFISNFQPFTQKDAVDFVERAIQFDQYTDPMKKCIREVAESGDENQLFVASSHPLIVNGAPSKNPRYLETRKDLVNGKNKYLAMTSLRLFKKVEKDKPLYTPVDVVLPGRRNNPAEPEAGIRPLAVYGPIHYQDLPELFMDFASSLTGKSPSTTGAGSEGALTKAPFNALSATTDLNNALLSFILTGYDGFTSAAGWIGKNHKVNHDISLLMPELWSMLNPNERTAKYMIERGFLEKVEDFEFNGETILGSRLGYRITFEFVNEYLGKMFEVPNSVFTEDMLKPELQSMEEFVDGIKNICEAQEKVAKAYLEAGSVEGFVPPLKALMYIMAEGNYNGLTVDSKEFRDMFTKESVLSSDWYKARLVNKQNIDIKACESNIAYLTDFLSKKHNEVEAQKLGIAQKLENLKTRLKYIKSDKFIESITGTIGADPLYRG